MSGFILLICSLGKVCFEILERYISNSSVIWLTPYVERDSSPDRNMRFFVLDPVLLVSIWVFWVFSMFWFLHILVL